MIEKPVPTIGFSILGFPENYKNQKKNIKNYTKNIYFLFKNSTTSMKPIRIVYKNRKLGQSLL